MSIIKFLSTEKLPTITATDLDGQQQTSDNGEFNCDNKWYRFEIVCGEGETVKFDDITINGESIEEQLYTGWAKAEDGEIRFIPFLNKPGRYQIWLHGNLGHYLASIKSKIKNGDYGKDLFEKYLFTVDHPMTFDFDVPESIRSFFYHAYGPEWWNKDDISLPYQILDFDINNQNELLSEGMKLPREPIFNKAKADHVGRKYKNDGYPLVPVEQIEHKAIAKLLKDLGYKEILNFMLNTIPAKSTLYMHTDENYNDKKAYTEVMQGCTQLYVILEGEPDKNFIKLGRAGIVPLDKPVIINNSQHPHCVVNASDRPRTTLLAYGTRN